MDDFCVSLGLRVRLSEFGVTSSALETVARDASNSFFNDTNPSSGSPEEYLRMLEKQM